MQAEELRTKCAAHEAGKQLQKRLAELEQRLAVACGRGSTPGSSDSSGTRNSDHIR